MANIIQTIFFLIPNFRIEYFSLIPVFGLILIGLLIEKHYVSRLTFFSNSLALISYFGLKENLSQLGGLMIIVYFVLTTWSFLSHITNNTIKRYEKYEKFIEENYWILKIGSSLVTGAIILYDFMK